MRDLRGVPVPVPKSDEFYNHFREVETAFDSTVNVLESTELTGSAIEKVLLDPDSPVPPCPVEMTQQIAACASRIKAARERGASVMLIYGAHLVKNGLLPVVNQLIQKGWITHLATNGAGTIHDWELSFLGRTEESVRENVATGTFGTWDETSRNIHLALLAGALRGEGYGRSLGRFIVEDGVTLPTTTELENLLRNEPTHPLAPARAERLRSWHASASPWDRGVGRASCRDGIEPERITAPWPPGPDSASAHSPRARPRFPGHGGTCSPGPGRAPDPPTIPSPGPLGVPGTLPRLARCADPIRCRTR